MHTYVWFIKLRKSDVKTGQSSLSCGITISSPGTLFYFSPLLQARAVCDWPFLANCDQRFRYGLKNMKSAAVTMADRMDDLATIEYQEKKGW